jgi:hypothetical protein
MRKIDGYISFGSGDYTVIVQGMPICANKKTLAEAMKAAEFMKVTLLGEAWNGERGEWVHLDTIEVQS